MFKLQAKESFWASEQGGEPIENLADSSMESECRVHGGQATYNGKSGVLERKEPQLKGTENLTPVFLQSFRQNSLCGSHSSRNILCLDQPEWKPFFYSQALIRESNSPDKGWTTAT